MTDIDNQLKQLYLDILKREPDQDGYQYYKKLIINKKI